MPYPQRQRGWKSEEKATDVHISEALEPAFRDIVFTQFLAYPSEDMNKGLHVELLAEYAKTLLGPLVALDPRGGLMNQADMQAAVKILAEKEEYKAAFEKVAQDKKANPEFLQMKLAYTIRVMLSHIRKKREQMEKLKRKNKAYLRHK